MSLAPVSEKSGIHFLSRLEAKYALLFSQTLVLIQEFSEFNAEKFKESGVEYSIETVPTKSVFKMAASLPNGEPDSLICDKAVVVDTELHIRHGSALLLRRVRWLVTKQSALPFPAK